MVVVAAVIERGGLILIGRRKSTSNHPLKWEFPGGKLEPGEFPAQALARELREELGIDAEIGEQLDAYDVRYGDGPLTQLLFHRVTKFEGEPENLDFAEIRWESPSNLASYDFLEGDKPFIKRHTNSA